MRPMVAWFKARPEMRCRPGLSPCATRSTRGRGVLLRQRLLAVVVAVFLENGLHARADLFGALVGRDLTEHHLGAPFLHDLADLRPLGETGTELRHAFLPALHQRRHEIVLLGNPFLLIDRLASGHAAELEIDRKSTRLNSSHVKISYAVFCL